MVTLEMCYVKSINISSLFGIHMDMLARSGH